MEKVKVSNYKWLHREISVYLWSKPELIHYFNQLTAVVCRPILTPGWSRDLPWNLPWMGYPPVSGTPTWHRLGSYIPFYLSMCHYMHVYPITSYYIAVKWLLVYPHNFVDKHGIVHKQYHNFIRYKQNPKNTMKVTALNVPIIWVCLRMGHTQILVFQTPTIWFFKHVEAFEHLLNPHQTHKYR